MCHATTGQKLARTALTLLQQAPSALPQPTDLEILQQYVPPHTAEPLLECINYHNAALKISRARSTKLGDYRPPAQGKPHRITVNHNLNKYGFLVTLVHEIAHMTNWVKHQNRVKPHGPEWKQEFQRLMAPFLAPHTFPPDVLAAVRSYMQNPAASSCADPTLMRTLRTYDSGPAPLYLEELPPNALFTINKKKIFRKGPQLRKIGRAHV